MTARLALLTASTLLLAPLLTGCLCTSPILVRMNERTIDTFNPSAVYRKPNTNRFALEGTRLDQHGTSHAFLIIREGILSAAHLQTHENLSLGDIREMYSKAFYNQQETTHKTPPYYEK